ncbi:MAG: hypothetical protein CME06_02010 [Gemmatimonadetes bacterium]|nr:hypothetical protein [Gemmatimonadota bacterium]
MLIGCGSEKGASIDADQSSSTGGEEDGAVSSEHRNADAPSPAFGAALFIRAFASYLELTGGEIIDRDLLEAAIEEDDYEGKAFAGALDLLNQRLEERGERPIPRPLPEGLGLSSRIEARPPSAHEDRWRKMGSTRAVAAPRIADDTKTEPK